MQKGLDDNLCWYEESVSLLNTVKIFFEVILGKTKKSKQFSIYMLHVSLVKVDVIHLGILWTMCLSSQGFGES